MEDPEQASRKTVVIINLYAEIGGGEIAMYHLVKELDKTRFRPIMVFNRRGPLTEKVEQAGVETAIVPYPTVMLKRLVRPSVSREVFRGARALGRFLSNERADIVHCSDVLVLLMLFWPVLLRRVPVVYSVIFFYEATRLFLFNLLALGSVSRIITNSEAVRKDLLRRTWVLEDKAVVVYPGVDTSEFRPLEPGEPNALREELGIPAGVKIVGMFARFDPTKGHLTLLEAAAIILRQRRDIIFVIVGGVMGANVIDAGGSYRDRVLRRHKELGLYDSVRFLGHREDPAKLMRCCDIVVVPSTKEGFGLVAIEAMASGAQVVATSSIGAAEIIAGSDCVVLAPPDYPVDLAEGILSLVCGVGQYRGGSWGDLSWTLFARKHQEIYLR